MTVIFHGSVQEHTSGVELFQVDNAANVRALIFLLGERFGEEFKDYLLGDDTCFFLVNGTGIMTTGGLQTPLHEGDTVEVLPLVGGG